MATSFRIPTFVRDQYVRRTVIELEMKLFCFAHGLEPTTNVFHQFNVDGIVSNRRCHSKTFRQNYKFNKTVHIIHWAKNFFFQWIPFCIVRLKLNVVIYFWHIVRCSNGKHELWFKPWIQKMLLSRNVNVI